MLLNFWCYYIDQRRPEDASGKGETKSYGRHDILGVKELRLHTVFNAMSC